VGKTFLPENICIKNNKQLTKCLNFT